MDRLLLILKEVDRERIIEGLRWKEENRGARSRWLLVKFSSQNEAESLVCRFKVF